MESCKCEYIPTRSGRQCLDRLQAAREHASPSSLLSQWGRGLESSDSNPPISTTKEGSSNSATYFLSQVFLTGIDMEVNF